MSKKFVFNDENTINSYGFRIVTSGIDTTRFEKNPICLNDHNNSTKAVLGRWQNIEKANGLLSAEPQFDTEDAEGKEVVRKVEKGTINACSMGVSFTPKNLKKIDGQLVLTECELFECSIVAVPSNANAVRLYHADGTEVSDTEVKNICLHALNDSKPNFKNNMDKIQLSAMALLALGFAKTTKELDEAEINEAVLGLKTQLDEKTSEVNELTQKLNAYEQKEAKEKEAKITEMVELAIRDGRITADKKDTYVDLAKVNFDLAKNTLESFPKKTNLSAGMNPRTGGAEPMTAEQFQKLTVAEQLAWKEANPDEYKKLFA